MTRSMSREEVREIDRRAIEEFGLPGAVLMENAGRGCVDLLMSLSNDRRAVVCCGKGNNAGDGFVMARHLENLLWSVRVLLFCHPAQLRGDARTYYNVLDRAGTPVTVMSDNVTTEAVAQQLSGADWIVDALLGTGAWGCIRDPFASAIRAINCVPGNVLAVDLPSGMDCDTGEALLAEAAETEADPANSENSIAAPKKQRACCVVADHTATFVARKLGFDKESAQPFLGKVHVIDIGVPRSMLRN